MARQRPQVPPPEGWHNPEPTPEPIRQPENYTPLQSEIVTTIEDIQRHLNTVLNRVDVNKPVSDCLIIKTARLNFLLGKYQASHDIFLHLAKGE